MQRVIDDSAFGVRARIEQSLRIDPKSKPRVYAQVYESAEIASLNYWLELVFSAGIATLGLVLDSPAVVIGAMLISPLVGPILAAGLALAAGDFYLGVKSVVNVLASMAGAVSFSAAIVWLLPFHAPTAEILSRTQPTGSRSSHILRACRIGRGLSRGWRRWSHSPAGRHHRCGFDAPALQCGLRCGHPTRSLRCCSLWNLVIPRLRRFVLLLSHGSV